MCSQWAVTSRLFGGAGLSVMDLSSGRGRSKYDCEAEAYELLLCFLRSVERQSSDEDHSARFEYDSSPLLEAVQQGEQSDRHKRIGDR
jgi:hypothetical protein